MPEPVRAPAAAGQRRRQTATCRVCSRNLPLSQLLPASLVRENIVALITSRVPEWSADSFICRPCLNTFRGEFVRGEMEKDRGELSTLEQEVIHSLHEGDLVADNLNQEYQSRLTLGERIADKVADFGGSWRFIILFFTVMAVWIVVNSVVLLRHPFDPYPYILLNLVLSLLAAVQAPIIMMSQNRQEARDRLRAENDYKVNLKAEIEVRVIGEKIDQLIHHQWEHLLEIQQIQMEMIEDLAGRRGH